MNTSIIVKTAFSGKHYWKDAPDEVKFLRIPHDHTFFVELEMEVFGKDRDEEFFIVKRKIDSYISGEFGNKTTNLSCESMSEMIINHLLTIYGERHYTVSVYEDNVNGGRVEYGS